MARQPGASGNLRRGHRRPHGFVRVTLRAAQYLSFSELMIYPGGRLRTPGQRRDGGAVWAPVSRDVGDHQ